MGWIEQLSIAGLQQTLTGLERVAEWRGSATSLPVHQLTGIQGEETAFFYLRRKGYTVVARRWSSGNVPGDVDLIAWHGRLLCFIEVKARSERDLSPAEIRVDQHKRTVLRRLARQYLHQLPPLEASDSYFDRVRFDVLSVYLVPGKRDEFVHFEGAFGWSERQDQA